MSDLISRETAHPAVMHKLVQAIDLNDRNKHETAFRECISAAVADALHALPPAQVAAPALAAELAAARAEIARLCAALAPFESAAQIFDQNGNFVGGEGGECLCSFITGEQLIEAAKARKST